MNVFISWWLGTIVDDLIDRGLYLMHRWNNSWMNYEQRISSVNLSFHRRHCLTRWSVWLLLLLVEGLSWWCWWWWLDPFVVWRCSTDFLRKRKKANELQFKCHWNFKRTSDRGFCPWHRLFFEVEQWSLDMHPIVACRSNQKGNRVKLIDLTLHSVYQSLFLILFYFRHRSYCFIQIIGRNKWTIIIVLIHTIWILVKHSWFNHHSFLRNFSVLLLFDLNETWRIVTDPDETVFYDFHSVV